MARHGRHGAPRAAVRAPSAPATAPFGFSRDTKHGLFPPRQTADARRRQACRLQGGIYEAVRKRVERGLSESRDDGQTFSESRRFPDHFPRFPTTIRRKDSDKPLLTAATGVSMDVSRRRLLPFLAKWRGEGRTGHESRNTAFDQARGAARFSRAFFPNHGFYAKPPSGRRQVLFTKKYCGAAMERLWRGMGGGRPPHRQHGLSGFHETRDPRPGFFRITAFLHAREFPYNHWGAAGRSSPACPHGSRRWLDTSPHL